MEKEITGETIRNALDEIMGMDEKERKALFHMAEPADIMDSYTTRQILYILSKKEKHAVTTARYILSGDCLLINTENRSVTAVAVHDAWQRRHKKPWAWYTHLILGTGETMVLDDEMLQNGQVKVYSTSRNIRPELDAMYTGLRETWLG